MSEAAPKGSEPSEKGNGAEKQGMAQNFGGIIEDIERFCRLSSEFKDCLSGITRKVIDSLNELKSVQQAVMQIKRELKELYDIETSAASLQSLHEEHRLKQSEFESFMENQRRLWEEEKALKEKEDEEYQQALKLRRKKEEEEYRQKLARDQLAIRQRLEEELRQFRQQNLEEQKLLEQDLLKRERALKEKELEWVRLIQELELFMTGLVERTRKENAGSVSAAIDRKKNAVSIHGGVASGTAGAFKKNMDEEEKTEIARELNGGENPSVASVREMLLSQGRRIENIQADLNDSREPVPFRLRPKDTI